MQPMNGENIMANVQYDVSDYNVTIFRGHVREDGRILHGIRSDGKLEWRTQEAYKSHEVKRKKRNAHKRARRKHWLNKYKTEKGCSVCGVKNINPLMLHLDHINPLTKVNNVCNLAAGNLKRLMTEVRKCRVLCFDCHIVHTAEQNTKGRYDDA